MIELMGLNIESTPKPWKIKRWVNGKSVPVPSYTTKFHLYFGCWKLASFSQQKGKLRDDQVGVPEEPGNSSLEVMCDSDTCSKCFFVAAAAAMGGTRVVEDSYVRLST